MVEIWQQNDAERHKARGNEYYRNGELHDAINEFRLAILKDPTNPVYYTNRAMALYKLGNYEEMLEDCERAVEKRPTVKGYYYRGLAQIELEWLAAADRNLKRAYKMSLEEGSSSSTSICAAILKCRKKQWQLNERKHRDRSVPLLAEVSQLYGERLFQQMETAKQNLQGQELKDEIEYLQNEHNTKMQDFEAVFKDAGKYKPTEEVPEYLLDPISFNLFVDPVITPSGNSFERAWILQHLKTSETDPFSRAPLKKQNLRTNIQLKAAAEAYIEKHGEY